MRDYGGEGNTEMAMCEQRSGTRVTARPGVIIDRGRRSGEYGITHSAHTWFEKIFFFPVRYNDLLFTVFLLATAQTSNGSALTQSFRKKKKKEGESKILSGSEPNINLVTSPSQVPQYSTSRCYVMELQHDALISYFAIYYLFLQCRTEGRTRELHKLGERPVRRSGVKRSVCW